MTQKAIAVINDVEQNPHSSLRQLKVRHDMSITTLQRLLKKQQYHPYKMILVQELKNGDYQRRLKYSDWIVKQFNDDPLFVKKTFFTDECVFSSDGQVCTQNVRYWAKVFSMDLKISIIPSNEIK